MISGCHRRTCLPVAMAMGKEGAGDYTVQVNVMQGKSERFDRKGQMVNPGK